MSRLQTALHSLPPGSVVTRELAASNTEVNAQLDAKAIDETRLANTLKNAFAKAWSENQAAVAAPKTESPKRSGVNLDGWAGVNEAPTDVPFETKLSGSVFRGMKNESEARAYADTVSEFFLNNGSRNTKVFVVRGPTSTTKAPFEVLSACCGYSIVYETKAKPKLNAPDDIQEISVFSSRPRM